MAFYKKVSKMGPEKKCLRFWGILGCQVQNDLKTLGKRFLAGHFNCAECRGPFPDGDFMKVDLETRNEARPEDGALSPNRPAPASRRTSRSANDADWTKPKPKPTARAFVAAAVCRACYASNHAERCACCAVPLVGCRFVRVDAFTRLRQTCAKETSRPRQIVA